MARLKFRRMSKTGPGQGLRRRNSSGNFQYGRSVSEKEIPAGANIVWARTRYSKFRSDSRKRGGRAPWSRHGVYNPQGSRPLSHSSALLVCPTRENNVRTISTRAHHYLDLSFFLSLHPRSLCPLCETFSSSPPRHWFSLSRLIHSLALVSVLRLRFYIWLRSLRERLDRSYEPILPSTRPANKPCNYYLYYLGSVPFGVGVGIIWGSCRVRDDGIRASI